MDGKSLGREPASFVPDQADAHGNYTHGYYGLTKRELFAAMVMQGLAANSDPQLSAWGGEPTANCAVKFADALLAELAKDQP